MSLSHIWPDRIGCMGAPDGVANREIRFFETVCVRGRYLLRGSQFSVDTRELKSARLD